MKTSASVVVGSLFALLLGGCARTSKVDIALSEGQTYQLQPSGKMKVYPLGSAEGASGSQPLHKLKVKKKNEGAAAKTAGCWQCTDCICNSDDCACTECTSC